jgi:predicted ATPase/class 3 adenylate cyclase
MPKLIRNRYEPLAFIARGGQGTVLRARDRLQDRDVAIKVRDVGGKGERAAALGEVRVLLDLRPHPNLPIVREDFFVASRYHIVMDWIEGTDLGRVLAARGDPGLPAASVIAYLEQAAAALDHLHAHRPPVVHRDVKPANLVLTSDGFVILVDFGIARAAGTARDSEGTRGYIAPEVAAGAPAMPTSDVYSFGATAFALLTGRPPEGALPDWEGVPAGATGVIERALRRALAYDPARRPARATEVVERLRAWLDPPPRGVVTLFLADVEGEGPLRRQYPADAPGALARYLAILSDAIEREGGRLLRARGEAHSLFAVFVEPAAAVRAALAAQRALAAEPWPTPVAVRARVGLHTGHPDLRELDYVGPVVDRCARVTALAHGGQTLLSAATAELARAGLPDGAALADLGTHRLRDLVEPERLFELTHPDLPSGFPAPPAERRHGLPLPLTSFVGREPERALVLHLLRTSRLVTLTGPGGSGKTRLAIEAARGAVEEFRDGVRFLDLAGIPSEEGMLGAVRDAVDGLGDPATPPLRSIADACGTRHLLLILDNCEHLIEVCAHLCDALLKECPHVAILTTSRERLALVGESTMDVPPLPVPEPGASFESLAGVDAVRLFVERGVQARPGFALEPASAGAVVRICARLDGIPLAIELAAARLRTLSCDQIAARLDDRFTLLSGGSRTALPRHQTLRGTLDWSYQALSAEEASLFRALAIFTGGFSFEAAEAVSEQPALVLDALAGLVDKSLVLAGEGTDGARYRTLETVQAYARERLAEAGEEAGVAARHLRWFGDLAVRAERELSGPDQVAWLARLEIERDNLRTALASALASDLDAAARVACALVPFWVTRGDHIEARAWLERACADVAGEARSRPEAEMLLQLGWVRSLSGDVERARAALGGAGAWFEAAGDLAGRVRVAHHMAATWRLTDIVRTVAMMGEAGSLLEEAGAAREDPKLYEDLAYVHTTRAGPGFERWYAASKALAEAAGDPHSRAALRRTFGYRAYYLGDLDSAIPAFEEAAALGREAGDFALEVDASFGLARIALARGDTERARSLSEFLVRTGRERSAARAEEQGAVVLARISAREGRPQEADAHLDRAESLLRGRGDETEMVEVLQARAVIALERGDWDEAIRHASDLRERCARYGDDLLEPTASLIVARALLGRGPLTEAWEALTEATKKAEQVGERRVVAIALPLRAEILALQGRIGEARAALEPLGHAGALRMRAALALEAPGFVAAAERDAARAVKLFGEAERAWAMIGTTVWHARVLAALDALGEPGCLDRAREVLAQLGRPDADPAALSPLAP